MSKKLERDSCSFYSVSTKGKIKSGTCSEVKTLDLFSLPRPIISHPPPLDKPDYVPIHEGSKKKVARLKEKKEIEQPISNYTIMRKKREEFRKSLADLISTDRREEEMSTELLSEEDKQLLRCHYYMKYGIDSKNVAPMDFEWLKNICKKSQTNTQSK